MLAVNLILATIAFFLSLIPFIVKTINLILSGFWSHKARPSVYLIWLVDFSVVVFSALVIYDTGITIFTGEHSILSHQLYSTLLAILTLNGSVAMRFVEKEALK